MIMLIGFMLLSGCDQPLPEKNISDHRMRLVILVPQTAENDAWSAEGYDAAERIRQQLNADVEVLSSSDPLRFPAEQQLKRVRFFLNEGVELVVGLGGQYESMLRALSERYTYTSFAVVGEVKGNYRNFAGVSGRFDDLGRVMAEVALISSDKKNPSFGFLGGMPFKNYQIMLTAYENWIYQYSPGSDIFIDWVGSFVDPDRAEMKARVLLDQGVDILLLNTGMGNLSIARLAEEYPETRLLVVDTEPRHDLNPDQILATGMMDIAGLVTHTAHKVSQGHWRGEQIRFSFDENVARLIINETLTDPSVQSRIQGLITRLRDGHASRKHPDTEE